MSNRNGRSRRSVAIARKTRKAHKPDRDEERKRQTVLTRPRTTVLFKLLAVHGVKFSQLPIPKKERNEQKIDAAHKTEAEQRGLDPEAYRKKTDTGYELFQKNEYRGLRIDGVLDQLREKGLRHTGSHWMVPEGKGPVIVVDFSTEGEEVPLPDEIYELLLMRFNDLTLWCNWRYRDKNDPSKGQFRLDTFNLAAPHIHEGESWELYIPQDHPNTYRLR